MYQIMPAEPARYGPDYIRYRGSLVRPEKVVELSRIGGTFFPNDNLRWRT